jgi:hypothetical protein
LRSVSVIKSLSGFSVFRIKWGAHRIHGKTREKKKLGSWEDEKLRKREKKERNRRKIRTGFKRLMDRQDESNNHDNPLIL